MIITQGYPLWAVVSRPGGRVECVPVVAWLMDGEPHMTNGGNYQGEPLTPIGPFGVIPEFGNYLTSQEQVDQLLRDFEQARREAAEAQAGKVPPMTVRRDERTGGATF